GATHGRSRTQADHGSPRAPACGIGACVAAFRPAPAEGLPNPVPGHVRGAIDGEAMISAVNDRGYHLGRSWKLRPVRKIAHWLQLRSVFYIWFRFITLLQRYGI